MNKSEMSNVLAFHDGLATRTRKTVNAFSTAVQVGQKSI